MNDIYVGALFSDSYLEHHGILGMKWGVRRFQREDGSLTSAGKKRKLVNEHKNEAEKNRGSSATAEKSKYRVTDTSNRVLRAVAGNSILGQKTAVRMNKGYKEDIKNFKKEYKEKKSSVGLLDKERNKKLRSLKEEYKKNKLDTATKTADAIYGKQSHELNRLNQSTSVGKAIIKETLLGGYGSLKYNEMKVNHNSGRGKAAVVGILANNANILTGGTLGIADSMVRRQTKVSRSEKNEVKQYRKERKKK